MAIFRRESPAAGTSVPAAPALAAGTLGDPAAGRRGAATTAATVIAAGTHLKGEVTGATELQILGVIEGAVSVEALVTVGTGGEVTGPVSGRIVRVVGRVTGNVTAGEIVEVGSTGSVEGDVTAPRVVIAQGAFFRGKVEMKGRNGGAPSPRPGAPAAAGGGRGETKTKSGADAPRPGAAEAGS